MLKNYFKDLWNRFIHTHIMTKVFIFLFITLEIFILVISFVKVDYTITTPGFLTEAMYMVDVDTENERGHILTVSVTEYTDVSLIQYWLAKGEKRVVLTEKKDDDLTKEQDNQYGIISKKIAINNAIINAYEAASFVDSSIKLVKEYKGMVVAVVSGLASTDIYPDDVITKINGVSFTSQEQFYNEYYRLVGSDRKGAILNEGDSIEFTVLRYNSEIQKDVELTKSAKLSKNSNGTLSLGLTLYEYVTVDGANSYPKFNILYNEQLDAKGGSGGAMMALSIYNGLLEKDITNGLIIAGTGTIGLDGNIGAIGGIEQKIIKAFMSGVDVFYVDQYDYDAAISACEKHGYNKDLVVSVSEFTDILNDLNERGKTNEQ